MFVFEELVHSKNIDAKVCSKLLPYVEAKKGRAFFRAYWRKIVAMIPDVTGQTAILYHLAMEQATLSGEFMCTVAVCPF